MKNPRNPNLSRSNFSKATGVLICLLLLTMINPGAKAGVSTTSASSDSAKNAVFAEAKILLVRMDEINAMDKATFSPAEKKELRKEVRVIKAHLKELEKGRYMPVGTLVILLLLPLIAFNLMQ